jgi:tRNA threonylcarbamoyladenosine biosynthesis protein TsaE
MNIHEGRWPLFHFDFYRLDETKEIASIGYDEFLYNEGISVIEWADRFGGLMPKENLSIWFAHKGERTRIIRFQAKGQRYCQLLGEIKDHSTAAKK